MTYEQKLNELKKDFNDKAQAYLRAEKDLSAIFGWGDSKELNHFLVTKTAFEEAGNAYHQFLEEVTAKNIAPETEYSGPDML